MPTKVCLVKAMVFPAVMYGCESWAIKKAEHWRTDAFELWCWGRLLRVPWTERRSNQSILKEISPEYSLEGLMLKLKLQYFGHLMGRVKSLKKTLMLEGLKAGAEGDDRGWDGWIASLVQRMGVWANFRRWWGQGSLACCSSWGCKEWNMTDWVTEQQQHWAWVVKRVIIYLNKYFWHLGMKIRLRTVFSVIKI